MCGVLMLPSNGKILRATTLTLYLAYTTLANSLIRIMTLCILLKVSFNEMKRLPYWIRNLPCHGAVPSCSLRALCRGVFYFNVF